MVRRRGRRGWSARLGLLAAGAALLASCGSPPAATARSGTADVAYAGSLELLNEKVIGPAFARTSGFHYQGRGGGSIGLSKEIAAGELSPGVFESIGSGPIESLGPHLAKWYVQVAASPIVVAYNPHSRFAPRLSAVARGKAPLSELFAVMAEPGFHLGRTNPATDPQGQAFAEMVQLAGQRMNLGPASSERILGSVSNSSQIYSETALEARLQAGQLDAASAFLSQAVQLRLPYVALPAAINFGSPSLAKAYAQATLDLGGGKVVHGVPLVVDVTALGAKPSPAAIAFVSYLLSPPARRSFLAAGYRLVTPRAFGDTAAMPAKIRADLQAAARGA